MTEYPFNKQEEQKLRVVEEYVPGKQITLAHMIANPFPGLYKKLGVIGEHSGALGIFTITPSEGAIIGADLAMKAADVELVFVDRFSGSLVISGDLSSVEAAMKKIISVLETVLNFTPAEITRS